MKKSVHIVVVIAAIADEGLAKLANVFGLF